MRKRKVSKKLQIVLFSSLLFGLSLAFSIFQINSLTALAYQVAEAESGLQDLKKANSLWEAEQHQMPSFREFETLAAELNFEKTDKVSYLKIRGGEVAQVHATVEN